MCVGYCINSVNIQQKPTREFANNRLAIIPHLNFSCNGRITNIRAGVNKTINFRNFPYFQVWRPSSTSSLVYLKVGEVQLKSDKQVTKIKNTLLADIDLTGNDTIEFQGGRCYRILSSPSITLSSDRYQNTRICIVSV